MKFTMREMTLAGAVLVLGLGALTWNVVDQRLAAHRKQVTERASLQGRLKLAERRSAQRPETEGRLRALLTMVPSYPEGIDVTAELLRTIEGIAARTQLTLVRRESEKEKTAGEVFEVAINCTWNGNLESITRFMYEVQSQSVLLDIRQLSITPARTGGGLSGTFSVACAYTRARSASGANRGNTP